MNSMMKFCLQISLWFFSLLDVSITKCLVRSVTLLRGLRYRTLLNLF